MSDQYPKSMFISKLDAARRQLDTAIRMWFNNDDPVSIHMLAHASYEIIHVVSKKRKRTQDLLFDTLNVKEEYRQEYVNWLKGPGNFFKHAQRDTNEQIEFHPMLTDLFIVGSLFGLPLAGEQLNDIESAFLSWLQIHRREWLTDEGKRLIDSVSVEHLQHTRRVPKSDFFKAFLQARARARARGQTI